MIPLCNGAARIITSFGPLIAGLLAAALGGFRVAAAIIICFALLSVVAMLMGRETKDASYPTDRSRTRSTAARRPHLAVT